MMMARFMRMIPPWPFTLFSGVLHGFVVTLGTAEPGRAIADSRLFHTQRKTLFTLSANTK
jgi:hypothetical protein